jgi:hypothetical protein
MINTILLSKNGCYVDENGNLPSRENVPWDKELLKAFCQNQIVSGKGFNSLPPSMRKIVKKQNIHDEEITMAVTIPEIANYSDVLLISRSSEFLENGKEFRLDKFQCLIKNKDIEIWIKK